MQKETTPSAKPFSKREHVNQRAHRQVTLCSLFLFNQSQTGNRLTQVSVLVAAGGRREIREPSTGGPLRAATSADVTHPRRSPLQSHFCRPAKFLRPNPTA